MKKVIVIILCVILALDAGLLIYGAVGKSEDVSSDLPGAYQAPAAYVKEGSTKWFDLSAIVDSDLSESDKAANLLVQAGYNHIYAKQFAHLSQTNVYTNASTPDVYIEILWVQEKYNRFYQSQSHAGSMNYSHRIIYWYDQRVEGSTTKGDYDPESGFSMNWSSYKAEENEIGYSAEKPRVTGAYFKLPIHFGNEELDSSLINASTIKITKPTTLKPYYTVQFEANIPAINESEESKSRFIDASGGKTVLSSPVFKTFTVTAEIWEMGYYRSLKTEISFSGKIKGKQKDGTAQTSIIFSYTDADARVANRIKETSAYDEFSAENKAKIEDELYKGEKNE